MPSHYPTLFTNSISKCKLRLLFSLVLLVLISISAGAQNIQNPQSAVDNLMRSGLHVDPSTGALQLQIPLGEYRGRGEASLPVALNYSSKVWNIKYGSTLPCNGEPVSSYRAEYAKSSASGWTSSLGWFLPTQDPSWEVYDSSTQKPSHLGHPTLWQIARMYVTLPDGSRHELRRDDSLHAFPTDLSGVYYSVDGSRLWYDLTSDTLFMPNGSRYLNFSQANGAIQYVDRNGNSLSYSSGGWTDTLGRNIGVPVPGTAPTAGDYTYTMPGVNGTTLTYTLRWRNLGDALTDPTQPLHYKGDSTLGGCSLSNHQSNNLFSSADDQEKILQGGIFNPVVLYQIGLPNNSNYTFTYNIYGEVDKIVYPTGGTEQFTYNQFAPLGGQTDDGTYSQGNRGVTSRVVSDGTTTQTWSYSDSGLPINGVDAATWPRTVVAPDGTRTETWFYRSRNPDIKYGFDDARTGMAREERVYNSAGTMIRRTLFQLTEDGPQSGGYSTATRNARVTKRVDIILDTGGDALAAATEMTYDSDLNVTSTKHYDYVSISQSTAQSADIASIPNGTLVRTEETDYLTGDANYRARNLLSLPTAARVKDGAGNIVAQSSFAYDETALQNIGSANGWVDPQTSYRGNSTTGSHWLSTTNSYLSTHASYDQFGNVRTTTDAKGNQTQLDYSSTYSYAYPTTVTSAVPDPAGQHGSTTALVTSSAYDLNTGLVTSATDANNITTTFEYNDALNRLTRTVRAAGNGSQSQTTMAYDDANRTVTSTGDQAAYNDNALKSQVLYDALGRTIESRQYEGGSNYIAVQTQYDVMGRAYKTSNPFRPWQSETAVWTTSAFDALGRVASVTTPDSAVVASAYSGSTSSPVGTVVTVTDQAGKTRSSVTDALGRLASVTENPGGLGYITSYAYDTLDNLTTVTQGSQTRSFAYDSLKRLTSATNPESGTVSYQYDANGNLTQKTDARGVVSTYAYDALNRNISVTYANDPANTPTVTRTYDGATNGKGRIWTTETSGPSASRTTIDSYDAMGRPLTQRQQFYWNNNWSQPFLSSATYDKASHVLSITYPSDHVTNYAFDSAGRMNSFTGNLGDSTTRTYANDFQYTKWNSLQQEKFGTDTPLYHKQRFNQRGQLWDMRLSTAPFSTDPADGDRGAIVNYYSGDFVQGGTSTDNNGNLLRQEIYIPGSNFFQDNFTYDSLNRLKSISEKTNGTGSDTFKQAYSFDRWGNRQIDQTNTSGANIPKPNFGVDPNTNRLTAPAGSTMSYDAAGNLTFDNSDSIGGTRTYDAENRMITATDSSNHTSTYTYDGDGHRVKRNSNTTETWQVYGLGGELIAEYAANGSPTSPQKEYGYRNGQLLVTADAPPPPVVNVALASNGGVASVSSWWGSCCGAETLNNGDRRTPGWNDAAPANTFPDWAEVDFNGSKTISEIDVFTCQDNWQSPSEPTETMTFSLYGLTGYNVQYWNGSSWVDVPSGSVSGNNTVWRKFTFSPIATTKVRVLSNASPDGYSRLTEIEAWTGASPSNLALASNGGVASVSSSWGSCCGAETVNDGARRIPGWNDAAPANTFPDWAEVDFSGSKTIGEIDVFTCQDNWQNPSEPTESMTFSLYGVTGYEVQYWNGSSWVDVPGGSVSGNNKVWRKFTFSPITTTKVRVLSNASVDGYSRLTEVEAWSAPPTAQIHWLVTDQLGTPRMIFDQSGSLANTSRHDYLPFGEELFANQGARTPTMGYGASDSVRQKFTRKERDNETGLDYFGARYFSSTQGRFTSVDPSRQSVRLDQPQSWNRYTYALNNPLAYVDQNGKWPTWIHELIIDRALPRLSSAQRHEIKEGSWSVDNPMNGGQNTSHANEHGETMPGQSQEDAAEKADQFINTNVDKAKYAFEHTGLTSSLWDFGRAFHTVTDMTSPAHEGYQYWYASEYRSHRNREADIDSYRMGLAAGATLSLYRYTYGQAALQRATGYTPGGANDPTVMAIESQYLLPGADVNAEDEALYEYRVGLREGLKFDWGRQHGIRNKR